MLTAIAGDDAEPVGDLARDDAAETEAEEDHGGGERNRAAGGREFLLHHRHHHHDRPHPDRADGADQDGQREPQPRLARVGVNGGESLDELGGSVHGAQLRRPRPPGQATWRDIGHADAPQQNPHRRWTLAFTGSEVIRHRFACRRGVTTNHFAFAIGMKIYRLVSGRRDDPSFRGMRSMNPDPRLPDRAIASEVRRWRGAPE